MPAFSQRIRELGRRVLREHTSPPRLGLAVAVGALVGSSPLLGLHALVALALASLFRLNRVGAFVGSNVSLGPLLPLWAAAEIGLGAKLLGRASWSPDHLRWNTAFTAAAGAWWLGWLFVGPVLGAATGGLTWWLARRRVQGATEVGSTREATSRSTPTPTSTAPPASE
jgi:uncharacterized protein (DUF2062 family)